MSSPCARYIWAKTPFLEAGGTGHRYSSSTNTFVLTRLRHTSQHVSYHKIPLHGGVRHGNPNANDPRSVTSMTSMPTAPRKTETQKQKYNKKRCFFLSNHTSRMYDPATQQIVHAFCWSRFRDGKARWRKLDFDPHNELRSNFVARPAVPPELNLSHASIVEGAFKSESARGERWRELCCEASAPR